MTMLSHPRLKTDRNSKAHLKFGRKMFVRFFLNICSENIKFQVVCNSMRHLCLKKRDKNESEHRKP